MFLSSCRFGRGLAWSCRAGGEEKRERERRGDGGVAVLTRVRGRVRQRIDALEGGIHRALAHSMPRRESARGAGGESRRFPLYALLALVFAWASLAQLQLAAMQQVV